VWGKENVNNEDKIYKRDVVFYKANPHTYIIIPQYRCFYIVKGMLLKGKVTAFRV